MTKKTKPSGQAGRHYRLISASLLLAGSIVTDAHAWNAGGHRLIAALAWEQLEPATRDALTQLLAAHPDYPQWIERASRSKPPQSTAPAERDQQAQLVFLAASTWADDIRSDPRFSDHPDCSPPLGSRLDWCTHKDWHYINQDIGASTPQPGKGQLHLQLQALPAQLANPGLPASDRAWALAWLIHLVGDAHQPLHAASRDDDAGGNELRINNPFHPRRPESSLHAYWDDLAAPPWLRGAALMRETSSLLIEFPAGSMAGPIDRHSTQGWLKESWALARQFAYPAPATSTAEPTTLSADFHQVAQRVARQRISQAGQRLAAWLNQLLPQATGRDDKKPGVSRETPGWTAR